ncbi:MAG: hypothetical protein CO150_01995 [Nitrospirae bacterium CG_4_9_14_3_um_filter_53_35]|nr:MAG: hypothetical protein AUK29_03410 [Nitrospirae bacterium CG2_30_53_67]PIS36807.1 MAG: hypothetical protein COT35_09260 [Nitrospirae bacterium CG08_land_8_20_14_0_20_52_24]PIV82822.1 MAG: hypothetical protein COW52_11650 [Nitrospirae bacterium CG17_big_fil_post_rev_8_21_14_2_50_50_9]PIW86229.1 MAG: hypothetical protein COZ95_00370 [Nitrospirae bacterium CG_4_8_14_3_um_filter_50_41]PIX85282.1 MAG: hypothetical protein COZ32_09300 [Nitrospirae bacterium CG_4_10_14_3_um_filter_53_41]PJA7716
MKAKNIMNPSPITIHADATIQDLVNLLNDKKFDGLCVVEGENKLVGVVTLFELYEAFLPGYVMMKEELAHLIHDGYFEKKCREIRNQPVRSIMRSDLVKIKEEDTLISVLADIVKSRLQVVPVTRGDTLIGMIHKKSLLSYTSKVLIENHSN